MESFSGQGYDLFFTKQGSGRPVFFVPSLLCDHEMFAFQARAMAEDYTVFTLDLPGHGRSGVPPEEPWTLEQFSDDFVALMDHLQLDSVDWVGLSIGGMIGLRVAIRHPERIRRLIVMNAAASKESPATLQKYMGLAQAMRAGQLPQIIDTVINFLFTASTQSGQPDTVDFWRKKILATDPVKMYGMAKATFERTNIVDQLPQIKVPTLVVTSEKDVSRTWDETLQMVNAIPGARFARVPQAGHLSAVEQPEWSTKLIQAFLSL